MMSAVFTSGRMILGLFFVLAGISKFMDLAVPVGMMEAEGLPMPGLLVWAVIALEIGAGLIVMAGQRLAGGRMLTLACIALVIFTLATNLAFHRFWSMEDALLRRLELSLFFKNLAVMGGLLVVAGYPSSRSGLEPRARELQM